MSVRENPLDDPLHMPGVDGCNLCDGRPYQTRLLATSETDVMAYPLCEQCWAAMMGGAQVGGYPPTPIDVAAAPPPKEIDHAPQDPGPAQDRPVIRAHAERLDRDGG